MPPGTEYIDRSVHLVIGLDESEDQIGEDMIFPKELDGLVQVPGTG